MDNSTALSKKAEGFLGQRMIVLPPDILRSIINNIFISNFYLTAIGFYPHARFHDRVRETGSDEYIFLYCTEGEGNVSFSNTELEIKPNQYIIIPPGISHHYKSAVKNPWSIYWVHFTGRRASVIYDRYCSRKIPTVNSIHYSEDRIKNFLDILYILDYSFDDRSLEISNVKLLSFLSSFVYGSELSPYASKKNVVTDSIEFMKKNLHENFKIEDFARNQNLSISRFSEIFKEKAGFPPMHYFITLKIQKSCQYLYFTDMSIKEICLEVGFSDPYYFSRVFKNTMGVAPSRYKEKYTNRSLI